MGEGDQPIDTVDASGRRVRSVEKIFATNPNAGLVVRSATIDWVYDELGRLAREIQETNGVDLLARYEYDLVGNRTSMLRNELADAGQTARFRAGGPMEAIGTHVTYAYDANDRLRTEEKEEKGTFNFSGSNARPLSFSKMPSEAATDKHPCSGRGDLGRVRDAE